MRSPGPESNEVRAESVRVHRVGGGDQPIACLHGFTGCAWMWGHAIPSGLPGPVLLLDLPGHGPGASSAHLSGRDFESVVDEVARRVREAVSGPADWVGYSMGGRIALGVAIRHPDVVRRLVLESASPGLADVAARHARRRRDEALARRIESGPIETFVDEWMRQPIFQSQSSLPDDVLDETRRWRLTQRPSALAAALRAMGTGVQPAYWDDLPDLQPPTLLLTGALDHKFEALAGQMARSIPRAVHRSIPGVGHTVHLEAPGRWLDAVRSFFQAQDIS